MKTQDGFFRHAIALIIVVGSFGVLFELMYVKIPTENKDMLNFAFGLIIGATLANVIRSYFPTKLEPADILTKSTSTDPAQPNKIPNITNNQNS